MVHWKKVIGKANDDLAMGYDLIQELANGSLLHEDRSAIVHSKILLLYVQGLTEYVRVVRSIVAAIGDLLCLDEKIDFQAGTYSLWNDIALLENALKVEKSWSGILNSLSKLNLSVSLTLESVPEIRSRVAMLNAVDVKICNLTLQMLDGSHTDTRMTVYWAGQTFMACAANFWSNRVESIAPDNSIQNPEDGLVSPCGYC